MTSLTPKTHGDRIFKESDPMPADVPTLAQCFRDGGYQAHAVGKLHVYPPRDRIGFDDVINNEEGRRTDNQADDYELFLQEQGYAGQEYGAGHCNNEFIPRAWHLPDHCHPTNWATYQMCKTIRRRDPSKPAFWYLSYVGPHQPMWPLQAYMDLYRDVPMDEPVFGDWSKNVESQPYMLRKRNSSFSTTSETPDHEIQLGRRAFYACITHIDHQIRTVIGTLREHDLLGNTIIGFTSDHGEMLGDHHLWTKAYMYDRSAKVPLLFSLPPGDERFERGAKDHRLAELRDVMPTLLDLAGLPIPETCEGRSLVTDEKRDYLYGEHFEGDMSTRMIRDEQYKLIYYSAGNVLQLFDLTADPRETNNLADDASLSSVKDRLTKVLIEHLYGQDLQWLKDGKLVGEPEPEFVPADNRPLTGQRGYRFL
jgi:arylsulfatase A-like enzyme